MHISSDTTPKEYVWRRVHSIMGLLIVLFLLEHLITNSQSALLIGENGQGFVRAVNFIKNLPYLPFLEIFLIGVPIAVHGVLGIKYAITGKMNSWPSKGQKPSLTKYSRNHAYSWQRITSWILLVGIILHVGYMRFYRYPDSVKVGDKEYYFTRLDVDQGLDSVARRLGVEIYNPQMIKESRMPPNLIAKEQSEWMKAITKKNLKSDQVMAVSPDFGTATLLMVRDAFKNPIKGGLYTIFVLAACFHAFNGLWTFCITWGWVIRARSQAKLVNICTAVMVLIAFLGLACIWGTYFVNLPR
jgi:succinate dehydrogenase / fumarate reductase, cytochrome b subunit